MSALQPETPIRAMLTHAHAALRAGVLLDPDESRLVLVSIQRMLVAFDRADVVATRRAAIQQRDAWVRRLAAEHYAGAASDRAKALAVLSAANAYRAGEWRHHRLLTACPPPIIGTPRELLWRAFRLSRKFPSSLRAIQGILSAVQK